MAVAQNSTGLYFTLCLDRNGLFFLGWGAGNGNLIAQSTELWECNHNFLQWVMRCVSKWGYSCFCSLVIGPMYIPTEKTETCNSNWFSMYTALWGMVTILLQHYPHTSTSAIISRGCATTLFGWFINSMVMTFWWYSL